MHLGRLERYFMWAAVAARCCLLLCFGKWRPICAHCTRFSVVSSSGCGGCCCFCWRSYFWQLNACGDGEDDDDGSCLVGCYVACRILSVIISPRSSMPLCLFVDWLFRFFPHSEDSGGAVIIERHPPMPPTSLPPTQHPALSTTPTQMSQLRRSKREEWTEENLPTG